MNEIWTYECYPDQDALPDPFVITIDDSTDPPTVTSSPTPDPDTIAGEDYRRLLELCFERADQFSLHRCGYPGSQPGALEEALRPFLAGTYRSYACLHVHDEQFWELCLLYRADPAAKEIILRHITHLWDREADDSPRELPEKYRAYEAEMRAARKRFDSYMDQLPDDADFDEVVAFDKENFREAKRLWKAVFDPADFASHMEDLCFFRGDGMFFETITHEEICRTEVFSEAFGAELRGMGAWAREEGACPPLFSLEQAKDLRML